jgi:hypothetical protein
LLINESTKFDRAMGNRFIKQNLNKTKKLQTLKFEAFSTRDGTLIHSILEFLTTTTNIIKTRQKPI